MCVFSLSSDFIFQLSNFTEHLLLFFTSTFSGGCSRMVAWASVVALAFSLEAVSWHSFTRQFVNTTWHSDFTSVNFCCFPCVLHVDLLGMSGGFSDTGSDLGSCAELEWSLVHDEGASGTAHMSSNNQSRSPQCKSAPLPAPQYACSLSRSRMDHRGMRTPPLGGLARPSPPQSRIVQHEPIDKGLLAPIPTVAVPRSLQQVEFHAETNSSRLHSVAVAVETKSGKRHRMHRKIPERASAGPVEIVRTRCASDSSLVMSLWAAVVHIYLPFSPLLQQIQTSDFQQHHVARLVNNFAASTLVKYLSALQVFHKLSMDLRLNLEGLTELQLADILVAGRLSKTSDDSTASPSMLIKSLRWGFKQLQIEPFSITFGSLISSFQMKVPRDRRESLPFGLYILTQFERRILVRETPTEEVLVLGSYLLLLFSGLRYSDLQRTSPTSLQWDGTTLRGLAWRTKTSCAGTPFGALACGFLSIGSYNWLYKWLVHLDRVLASSSMPSIDFMIPSVGPEGVRNPVTPMSYAESLFFLRHFLTLPWKKCPLDLGTSPQSYTIHGLKSTLISWATQLDLPDEHKRLQGKHQSRNSSTRLYSRDDVHGALKLQQAIVKAVQEGWKPVTPLARGGQLPLVEPSAQLERFNKQAPEHTWQYFRFQGRIIDVQEDEDVQVQDEVHEVEASSSSDSEMSSSSSSDSSVSEHQKRDKRQMETVIADEVTGALHRNTWHVMMGKSARGDTEVVQTACGRFFDVAQLKAVQELEITGSQTLCGHPGCRKGWLAVGA